VEIALLRWKSKEKIGNRTNCCARPSELQIFADKLFLSFRRLDVIVRRLAQQLELNFSRATRGFFAVSSRKLRQSSA
jgi:hypothetical protein